MTPQQILRAAQNWRTEMREGRHDRFEWRALECHGVMHVEALLGVIAALERDGAEMLKAEGGVTDHRDREQNVETTWAPPKSFARTRRSQLAFGRRSYRAHGVLVVIDSRSAPTTRRTASASASTAERRIR